MPKLKIAIFDLTDCEGCELVFVNLREQIFELLKKVEIVNWRLTQEANQDTHFDIAFVEGTSLNSDEIKQLKKIRANSDLLIALGSCACLGGVQGMLSESEREKYAKKIYGDRYRLSKKKALPLCAFVKVDYFQNGCPIDPDELKQTLADLMVGRQPQNKTYAVCFQCKAKQNHSLLKDNQPCLGPITKGGCNAFCPTNKLACTGCWGLISDPQIENMKEELEHQNRSEHEINKILDFFLSYQRKNPD